MKKNLVTSLLISMSILSMGHITETSVKASTTEPVKLVATDFENLEISVTTNAAVVVIEPGDIPEEKTIIEEELDFNNEYIKANEILSNFKASNSTQEQDIIDAVKKSLDSFIYVSFGRDNGKTFNKNNASKEEVGSITGALIVSDGLGNSKEIQVYLTIDQLKTESVVEQGATTIAAVTVSNVVTELKANVEGDRTEIGNTLKLVVVGDDSLGEEVKLDESKLTYKWLVEGQVVGTESELTITEEFNNKNIDYTVDYPDGEGGIE